MRVILTESQMNEHFTQYTEGCWCKKLIALPQLGRFLHLYHRGAVLTKLGTTFRAGRTGVLHTSSKYYKSGRAETERVHVDIWPADVREYRLNE